VARILIVGGGCRGRRLASELTGEGHAVRITTRAEAGRAAIEATGAECWIGTPDRLATLRGALANVTVACWLLGTAAGAPAHVHALHDSRLEFFLGMAIDTTVRGFVYEASGAGVAPEVLAGGAGIVRGLAERNAIPAAFLTADPDDPRSWLADARSALGSLLGCPSTSAESQARE
jgi:nucleoside-diphosphate-sugar epimerase